MSPGSTCSAMDGSESSLTSSEQEGLLRPSSPLSTSRSSSHARSICPPAGFDFPALSRDGSVQPLTAETVNNSADSHRRTRVTPPAALSSLGSKAAAMANSSDLDRSIASLADQYDMLDDVSISSNDDHDTASLASTPHASDDEEARGIFEDKGSLVDLAGVAQMGISSATFVADPRLSASSLTDDLDTPRQSLHSILWPASKMSEATEHLAADADSPLRVLFVAHRGLSPEVMQRVIARLGSSSYAACRLDVRHCVDAGFVSAEPQSYRLYIRHPDTAELKCVDLNELHKAPLLAVFYVTERSGSSPYPAWFDTVKQAMAMSEMSSMTILGSTLDTQRLDSAQLDRIYDSDVVLPYDALMSKDISTLRSDLAVSRGPQLDAQEIHSVSAKTVPLSVAHTPGPRLHLASRLGYAALLSACFAVWFFAYANPWHQDEAAALAARRTALSDALVGLGYADGAQQMSNTEHLLPRLTASVADDDADYVPFQGLPPNHIIVSLLRQPGSRTFPKVSTSSVYTASNNSISHNLTRLIDGVYAVSIAPESAYGQVSVNMLISNPYLNVTASHDFGRRPFQLNVPSTAVIAQAATKELMVVRDATVSWTHRLAAPLNAGLKATRNVTTELAIYAARDLQVFGNTALSVIAKAARESNVTLASVRKDLMVLQREVIVWTGDVQRAISETAQAFMPSRPGFRASLDRSHQQARRLTLPLRRKWNSLRKSSAVKGHTTAKRKVPNAKAVVSQARPASKALSGPLSGPAADLSDALGPKAKNVNRQHQPKSKGNRQTKLHKSGETHGSGMNYEHKKGKRRDPPAEAMSGTQHA